MSGESLSRLPALELILVTGTSFEYVDRAYCERHGVTVCNTPGYTGSAVAEHAFALFLSLAKRIPQLDAVVRQGADVPAVAGLELAGKTAGIVGYGDIGSRIGSYAAAFDMFVIYASRTERTTTGARRVELHTLFEESDVIFLALPETPETSGMVDAAAIERMSDTAILVNVSAEALVERSALIDALTSGGLGGAALDIIGPHDAYLDVADLIVTPARGWYTPECMERRAVAWMETLEAYLGGHPRSVVIGG